MDLFALYKLLRAEIPDASAIVLLLIGAGVGWTVAMFLLKQQISSYKTRIEHLQDVILEKLPASKYKPLYFRKERPVLVGIGIVIVGIAIAAVGVTLIVSNLKVGALLPPTSDTKGGVDQQAGGSTGPLIWSRHLSIEGGPLMSRNVFALQFDGRNSSAEEVTLKSAEIVSLIDGSRLSLEIAAGNEVVPLTSVNSIPAGASITLFAKFGPPNPDAPGKVLGISSTAFLEKWRNFDVRVEDNSRSYRWNYDEKAIAPLFPSLIGPRVSKKP